MTPQSQLLEAHVELTCAIRASEVWEESYHRAPKQLRALIRNEAELQASVNDYLLGLRERVASLVNWYEVHPKLTASDTPPQGSEEWTTEEKLLAAAVALYLLEMTALGAQAGEVIYVTDLSITTLDDFIIKAAASQTAQLVSGVTNTTRTMIQRAVQQSIAQGEDVTALTARIQRLVANPVRAEMIARTESVNAYQAGMREFAKASGAESSTWECKANPCKICAPMDGKTVKTGEMFVLPNGSEILGPTAHTNCKCGTITNYPKN